MQIRAHAYVGHNSRHMRYLEDDDVEFWREKTEECGVSTQGDGYAQSSDLDLKQYMLWLTPCRIVKLVSLADSVLKI